MFEGSYAVMDRLPGATLNELTYKRPEVIEDNRITIAYQLGMHMAFSFVFGAKDGYQTNYIFDPVSRMLTRLDRESFFDLPLEAEDILCENDRYTQEIAACELSNLKYIPSFRDSKTKTQILYAFKTGFLDKLDDIKRNNDKISDLIGETRLMWLDIKPVEDLIEYNDETRQIKKIVEELTRLDGEKIFKRLLKAKKEVEEGKYKK
jgi:hypothetical protein